MYYKGVIIFYIMIAILSFIIVMNNNRINEMNLESTNINNLDVVLQNY